MTLLYVSSLLSGNVGTLGDITAGCGFGCGGAPGFVACSGGGAATRDTRSPIRIPINLFLYLRHVDIVDCNSIVEFTFVIPLYLLLVVFGFWLDEKGSVRHIDTTKSGGKNEKEATFWDCHMPKCREDRK